MIVIDSQVHASEANTAQRPWHTVPNWPSHVTGDEMVAAMDDAGYAVDVQRAHPGRRRRSRGPTCRRCWSSPDGRT
jgi:hypothetical protein